MNEFDVKRLALILAIQAKIEGMKAANFERRLQERSLAYDENTFKIVAEELRCLAYKHNDQL